MIALNAILQIIGKKNLMEINLENAFVKMVTMMMAKTNYVYLAHNFGIYFFLFYLISKYKLLL